MKVLVGCPTYFTKKYCLDKYKEGLDSLSYKGKEILLVDNSPTEEYLNLLKSKSIVSVRESFDLKKSRDRIVACRNLLRMKAIKEGFDYFLSLEQDVVPPSDIIEKLLANDKAIVSAVVWYYSEVNGKRIPAPLLWDYDPLGDDKKMVYISREDLKKPQLKEIKVASLSCILIRRDVLQRVKFRYQNQTYDDMMFCKDARRAGFKIFVDTTQECTHYYYKVPKVIKKESISN